MNSTSKLVLSMVGAAALGGGAALVTMILSAPIETQHLTFTDCTKLEQPLAIVPGFSLTPAAPNETPLQRWQRTRADWNRASDLRAKAEDQIDASTVNIAIGPYADAEKAIETAKCGSVCVPEKQP